jgi:hypothetical protein
MRAWMLEYFQSERQKERHDIVVFGIQVQRAYQAGSLRCITWFKSEHTPLLYYGLSQPMCCALVPRDTMPDSCNA